MGGSDTKEASTDLELAATVDEGLTGARGRIPAWLGERYRVVRVLGRGGMGDVYLAVDEALVYEVALKRIASDRGGAEADLARLRDEVRLAQKVTHLNVCRTYDLEHLDDNWLVKMEYIAGDTLAQRLEAGPLSLAAAVDVTTQICAGLAVAHRQGVVHRDLKPHNIMIETSTGRVVLMDFGIARAAALAGKTAENVSGTPEYMAPEQVRGREVDGRADLYALGCVLYEMLTGERVFPGKQGMAAALAHSSDPAPALPNTVPERIRGLVARLLEKDPARRPAGAEEVAAALLPPSRRPRWLVPAAVAVVAAIAAAVVLRVRPPHRWQAQIRELPAYDEDSDSPRLSPDGKQITYSSDREQRTRVRVYVAPVDGGPPRVVTPPELNAVYPSWTRDGKSVLFFEWASTPRAFRVAVSGASPPEVVAQGATLVEDCGDRLVILYVESPGCNTCQRLVLHQPDGQERDLVQFTTGQTVFYPRCDRAGRNLLYSLTDVPRIQPLRGDIWLLALDGGTPRRLTQDRAVNIGTFAPDGRSIVYSSWRDGVSRLWEMPLAGAARPVQLTFGSGGEMSPDVSADGRLLLYDVDESSLHLFERPISGGPSRQLTHTIRETLGPSPRPTPDGRAIIVTVDSPAASPTKIMSIPLDGGDPVALVDGEVPAVTLDGAEVLYTVMGTRRIMAVPRAGGTPRLVTEAPDQVRGLQVGPDGHVHMVVLGPHGREAWRAPLAGGPSERDLPEPWFALSPAPRGGWRMALQYLGMNPWRAVILPPGASLGDPSAHELLGSSDDLPTWMPDGLSLLYIHDRRVHRYFVATGEDQTISEEGEWSGLAASSDGTRFYNLEWQPHVRRQLITNFADR